MQGPHGYETDTELSYVACAIIFCAQLVSPFSWAVIVGASRAILPPSPFLYFFSLPGRSISQNVFASHSSLCTNMDEFSRDEALCCLCSSQWLCCSFPPDQNGQTEIIFTSYAMRHKLLHLSGDGT